MVILINVSNTSIITTEPTTTQSIYEKAVAEIRKLDNDLKRDEEQLRIDRENFEEEKKQMQKTTNNTDVFRLNVGGEIMMTTRQTLTRVPKSILSRLFNGRWEQKLQNDQNGNIFFDFNPIVFRHLLDQLQLNDVDNLNHLSSPSEPSLVTPFKKMIRKLGLNHLLSLENNIFTFNVGGQIMTNQRRIFNQISNYTLKNILSSTKSQNLNDKSDVFIDSNPKFFRHLINQLREVPTKNMSNFKLPSYEEIISFKTMLKDLNISRKSNIFYIRIVLLCFQLDFTEFIIELSSFILKSSNKRYTCDPKIDNSEKPSIGFIQSSAFINN